MADSDLAKANQEVVQNLSASDQANMNQAPEGFSNQPLPEDPIMNEENSMRNVEISIPFNQKENLSKPKESAHKYKRVLLSKPDDAQIQNKIGVALAYRGGHLIAATRYDSENSIDPSVAETFLHHGNRLASLGKLKEAIESYEVAIFLKSNYVQAYYQKANALADLGNHEEAIGCYTRVLGFQPKNEMAFNNKGNCEAECHLYEEAIESLNQAIALKADFVEAYYNKGIVLSELGSHEDAIACFDKVLALKPDYVMATNNKGNCQAELGLYQEAIESFDEAIALDQELAQLYNNKGTILAALGKHQEALENFDKALSLQPDYTLANQNRGCCLLDLGMYEEAIQDFERAESFASQGDNNRAKDEAKRKNWRSFAESGIQKETDLCFLETSDKDDKALKDIFAGEYFKKGLYFASIRKHAEAVENFNLALSFESEDELTYLFKAESQRELGLHNQAIESIDRSLLLEPFFAKSYFLKAMNLSSLGKKKEAIQNFDFALSIGGGDGETNFTFSEGISKPMKEKMIESFKKAVPLEKNLAAEAYRTKALYLAEMFKKDEALESLTHAIMLDPTCAHAYLLGANCLFFLGRPEEAILSYEMGSRFAPKELMYYFGKALCLYFVDRKTEANETFERIIALRPDVKMFQLSRDINSLRKYEINPETSLKEALEILKGLPDADQSNWILESIANLYQEPNFEDIFRVDEMNIFPPYGSQETSRFPTRSQGGDQFYPSWDPNSAHNSAEFHYSSGQGFPNYGNHIVGTESSNQVNVIGGQDVQKDSQANTKTSSEEFLQGSQE